MTEKERTMVLEFTDDEIKKLQEYQVLEEIPGSIEDVVYYLFLKLCRHIEDTKDMTSSQETVYTLKKIVAEIAKGPNDKFCQ